MKLDKKYSFIFLTLTAPSVSGERLRDEIDDYAASFKRFAKLKEFEKMNVGYIRKLEITYNKKRNDYHPHYHILICVNKSYFTSRDYIKHEKWLDMWRLSKEIITLKMLMYEKLKIQMKIMYMQRFQNIHQRILIILKVKSIWIFLRCFKR